MEKVAGKRVTVTSESIYPITSPPARNSLFAKAKSWIYNTYALANPYKTLGFFTSKLAENNGTSNKMVDISTVTGNIKLVGDPYYISAIVSQNNNDPTSTINRGWFTGVISSVFGYSIASTDKPNHALLRDQYKKHTNNGIHLNEKQHRIDKLVAASLLDWENKDDVDILPNVNETALRAIIEITTDMDSKDTNVDAISRAVIDLNDSFRKHTFGLPFALIKSNVTKSRYVLNFATESILQKDISRKPDNLAEALVFNLKRAEVPDKDLRDLTGGIILAGQEVVVSLLNYCIYQLGMQSGWQDRIYAEIRELSDDGRNEYLNNYQNSLGYFVMESMRTNPPAHLSMRMTQQKLFINDPELEQSIPLEAGTTLIFSQYHSMQNPKYWENPKDFLPDRFHEKGFDRTLLHTFGGTSPNNCPGEKFAIRFVKTFLLELIKTSTLKSTPNDLKPYAGSALFYTSPFRVSFTSRNL